MMIKISDKLIGEDQPIFFIAEAGVNHNGSLSNAKKLIDVAKESGADAVKFQSFFAEEMMLPMAPKSTYHIETTSDDKSQSWMELLKTQQMSYQMHVDLMQYCKKKEIIFLSTPYDTKSVDMLFDLGISAFKIASTDMNNHEILSYISKKNKPIILSTAMSFQEEVISSINLLLNLDVKEIVLMHCTGSYPTHLEDSNLNVIKNYKRLFSDKCLYGYSDHTKEFINPVATAAIGISVYEKHFTLDNKLPGPDHRMSLEPNELKKTIKLIRETESTLGEFEKTVLKCEIENREKLRKSLVAKLDIAKGTKVTKEFLTSKRPGTGIPPSEIDKIVGKVALENIIKNTILKKNMFKNNE